MTRGKIASQVAHAIIGCYKNASKMGIALNMWEEKGSKMDIMQAFSESELTYTVESAQSNGIPAYIFIDAGRTQVDPNTKTAGAIGPLKVSEISAYLGKLKKLT